MSNLWTEGNRERMLEALRLVLGGIGGVKTVRRLPPTHEMNVSENETPAIFIDDSQTAFDWVERHGRRLANTKTAIILDCHAIAASQHGRRHMSDAPTLRNAFIHRIILELANNPTLKIQLADEAEAVAHAKDVAESFRVDTVPIPAPWIRFALVIQGNVEECFDTRTKTAWENLIFCGQPETPGVNKDSAIELTLDIIDLGGWIQRRFDTDLVAHYELETFANLKDIGPNEFNLEFEGDITRGVLPLSDDFVKSTFFSGGSAWRNLAELKPLVELDEDASFSLVAFSARRGDTGADQTLVRWGNAAGPFVELFTNDTGETRFRFLADGAGNTAQDIGGGASSLDVPTLHVAVIDRATNEARVYQNGSLVATLANLDTEAAGFTNETTDLVAVGANAVGPELGAPLAPTSTLTPFEGSIQTIAIGKVALTAADATRLTELAGLI